MLSNVLSLYHKNIIVFGNFNYPDINWEIKSLADIMVPSTLFLDTINDLFLNQLVSEPTRCRHGQKSNLLDIVLTNKVTRNIYTLQQNRHNFTNYKKENWTQFTADTVVAFSHIEQPININTA